VAERRYVSAFSGVKYRNKWTSLLNLSAIFEKSACNKVNFFCSTFTWNEVVLLRSNVLLRYFHFVAKYFRSLLSNFYSILRNLFLI
jgi:hypothetical protein